MTAAEIALLLVLGFAPLVAVRTPGALCTAADHDFARYAYPAHVAICRRHVLVKVKAAVARLYRLPRRLWATVEWDHLVPLCAGGSNAPENIWPEPLEDARRKDALEDRLCAGLRAGRLSQAQVLAEFQSWPSEGNGP